MTFYYKCSRSAASVARNSLLAISILGTTGVKRVILDYAVTSTVCVPLCLEICYVATKSKDFSACLTDYGSEFICK